MELTDDENAQLARALGVTDTGLASAKKALQEAAFEEYVRVILGQRSFRHIDEVREFRLLLLFRTIFQHKMPTEDQVGRLFHTTRTQSVALIRSTMAAFQEELFESVRSSAGSILSKAKPHRTNGEDVWLITTDAQTVSILNGMLASTVGGSEFPPIIKMRETLGMYRVNKSSYAKLKEIVGA
ncbi:hypothetical protein [Longispora urticae]